MTQIEQILEELDRRIDLYAIQNQKQKCAPKAFDTSISDRLAVLKEFKAFVSSLTHSVTKPDQVPQYDNLGKELQSLLKENGVTTNYVHQDFLYIVARHFAQWGVSHVKKSDISQPVAETCKENGDSLTDEELEKFRTDYVDKEIERIYPDLSPHLPRKSKLSLNVFNGGDLETAIDNAVRWQKEQMMKDAIEGYVSATIYLAKHCPTDIAEIQVRDSKTAAKVGEKVKVIIIKE